jgi:hypothetical protein
MAAKAPKSVSSGKQERMRHFSDEYCKAAAREISGQLRDYPAHLALWEQSTCEKMLAPVVPIWGPDFATVKEKITRLYHPAEAAVIIENLTA